MYCEIFRVRKSDCLFPLHEVRSGLEPYSERFMSGIQECGQGNYLWALDPNQNLYLCPPLELEFYPEYRFLPVILSEGFGGYRDALDAMQVSYETVGFFLFPGEASNYKEEILRWLKVLELQNPPHNYREEDIQRLNREFIQEISLALTTSDILSMFHPGIRREALLQSRSSALGYRELILPQ